MKVVSGQWLVARKTASSCACWGVGGRRSHSRSLPPRHSPLATRSGITLLEVLISIFILSIGLLGVASLIPAGKLMLVETNKCDRTGACGRAALRDVKVRRMLDYSWKPNLPCSLGVVVAANGNCYQCTTAGTTSAPQSPPTWPTTVGSTVNDNGVVWTCLGGSLTPYRLDPYVLDPMKLTALPAAPSTIGPLQRINAISYGTTSLADATFRWQDELTFDTPSSATARPNRVISGGVPQNDGNFSWFLTVSPSAAPATATVSAVVCHKRDFSVAGEATKSSTANPNDVRIESGPIGYGGMTISVDGDWPGPQRWRLKDNDWVLLCAVVDPLNTVNPNQVMQASWYRVVGVGYDSTTNRTNITLVGPDWNGGDGSTTDSNGTPRRFHVTSIQGVTGVYTTTVQLDSGLWTQ